jgi:hypothetical protein
MSSSDLEEGGGGHHQNHGNHLRNSGNEGILSIMNAYDKNKKIEDFEIKNEENDFIDQLQNFNSEDKGIKKGKKKVNIESNAFILK